MGGHPAPTRPVSQPPKPAWKGSCFPHLIKSSDVASHISGAQRLANGNTLVCDGPAGTFFEVTVDGETRSRLTGDVDYDSAAEVAALCAVAREFGLPVLIGVDDPERYPPE